MDNSQIYTKENSHSSTSNEAGRDKYFISDKGRTKIYNNEVEEKAIISKKTITILILVLLAMVIIGFMFLRGGSGDSETLDEIVEDEIVEEIVPTSSPPTEPVVIDISEINVQILNGSGVAGEASKVKAVIEGEGFEKFEVGNAQSFDHIKTQVRFKKEIPKKYFDKIENALSESYDVVFGDVLDEEADFDVVIIVGKKKGTESENKKETESETDSGEEAGSEESVPTSTPTSIPTSTPTGSESEQE